MMFTDCCVKFHRAPFQRYSGPYEFVDDARTVFLNCEEFNEDDSEVSCITSLGITAEHVSRSFLSRFSLIG